MKKKDDDKITFKRRLKEIDKDMAWQKELLKKGEIPYELYLEFVSGYEKEKRTITDDLAKGSKGDVEP